MNSISASNLRTVLPNICVSDYYYLQNGRKVDPYAAVGKVSIVPRVLGGKGGFGSMLRAIGAQIEKTTNREACRDLSGRRLRDIKEEKMLKDWMSQKDDRAQDAEKRRKKKLEKLCQEPKVEFDDAAYEQQRSELLENVSISVEQGLKAGLSKRKAPEASRPAAKKPKGLLLDVDIDDDDISTSDSDSDDDKVTGPSDKIVSCIWFKYEGS